MISFLPVRVLPRCRDRLHGKNVHLAVRPEPLRGCAHLRLRAQWIRRESDFSQTAACKTGRSGLTSHDADRGQTAQRFGQNPRLALHPLLPVIGYGTGFVTLQIVALQGESVMREIIAIIVAGTAFLCAVAAEIIVIAETSTRAQKPIPADLDETFGGRMQIDQQRLFQCFHRDRYPRASLQNELGPKLQDWYAVGTCHG